MKCWEGRNSAPLSASTSPPLPIMQSAREIDDAKASITRTTEIKRSCYTLRHHCTNAASVIDMPLLQPAVGAAPLTPSQGLSRYYQGLAAGDDLAELIRSLRSSIATCYQDCVLRGLNSTSDERTVDVAPRTSESTKEPLKPHPLPPGSLSASQRRAFWSASRAAFLFAAESPAAAEEATMLHCASTTRSVLYPYYFPMGENADTGGASASAALSLPLHSRGVLRGADMTMIWSDTRIVEVAKEALKHDPRRGWQAALRVLHQVAATPLTCAVELELYRQTDGHHWAEALRCLWTLPSTQWTEMDVGAVLRALYHAGRRVSVRPSAQRSTITTATAAPRANIHNSRSRVLHRRSSVASSDREENLRESSDHGSEAAELPNVFLARLIAQALRVHRAVEERRAFCWSTPSAFNDTLGLVSHDPSAWREACLLLDKVLHQRTPAAVAEPQTTTVSEAPDGHGTSTRTDDGNGNLPTATTDPSNSALYALVRPNAVTIHQACRALSEHWAVGLHYVERLQECAGGGGGDDALHLASDIAATEDVLRLCIAGQRWQEALCLVRQHQRVLPEKPATTATSAMPAELLRDRRHFRPDVFVQLVRLLGAAPAARPMALELIQRSQGRKAATTATASSEGEAALLRCTTLSKSKHYNTDTLSRAYNCLLQGSATLTAAEPIVHELNHQYSLATKQPNDVSKPSEDIGSALTDNLTAAHDGKLAGLETESVAHIAYLACVAGEWQRALHHTNALLHAPAYQATFFPTARLHDAVQYALEQAPAPGPPWQVSLKLFTEMMERNVPSSEVSFQSVVKRCFAGGAPDQAQKLFHLVLKRGVRS